MVNRIMTCPPIKSPQVKEQLCGLLYYPSINGGCKYANMCNKKYQRWLREEEEVRRLEGNDNNGKLAYGYYFHLDGDDYILEKGTGFFTMRNGEEIFGSAYVHEVTFKSVSKNREGEKWIISQINCLKTPKSLK